MAITHNTGITQYLKYGTSSSADTAIGRVTGGELRQDSGLSWQGSVGGKHVENFGIWAGGGTATLEVYNSTVVAYAQRASYTSPSLTALTFGGGLVGGNAKEFTQTGCYINSLDVGISLNSMLTATIEWFATDQADAVLGDLPALSGDAWRWFEGQCSFAGSTYALQSSRFTLNNGLQRLADIETKAATEVLIPESFAIGPERVTASFEMLTQPLTTAWHLHGDAGVTGVSAVISCSDGTDTLTFTLANLAGRATRLPFATNEGLVVFSLDLEAEPNASDSLTIAYSGG